MQSLDEAVKLQRIIAPKLTGLRNRHFMFLDLVILCVTPLTALCLLQDSLHIAAPYLTGISIYILVSLAVRLYCFYSFGVYRRYWSSAAVEDLVQLVLANVVAVFVIICLFATGGWTGVVNPPLPRFLPILDGILTLGLVGATRFTVRLASRTSDYTGSSNARPALIVGAGKAGERIVRELRASAKLHLRPVGFLDDDAHKHGLHIQGIPVLGSRQELARAVKEHDISQVIIALPSVSGKIIRETLALCEDAHVQAMTMPSLTEILSGKLRVSELRRVDIEDILRREPIQTNIDAVRRLIHNQRVLITGAGGSIGSELCRQVFAGGPSAIGLLGHGENSIFDIYNELSGLCKPGKNRADGFAPPVLCPIIADIRSSARLNRVLAEFKPDIVLHAAAHKHVPLMQENPTEAVSNNIIGTKNLVDASLAAGIEHLVMISTDKVVNPSSVMGASKRIAEMLVLQAAKKSGRHYVAVRFGNVLGSRGSVVPTFKKQIAAGGPVTVSHPDMTRYFITIPEAVQLVLQAAVLGHGGEVFMLDMGEPVAIVDLARDLIELSGLEVGRDIDIVYTGIRPGEKLCEELFVAGEVYEPTHHDKIRIAKNAGAFVHASLNDQMPDLIRSVEIDDKDLAMQAFRKLVPGFQVNRPTTHVDSEIHTLAAVIAEPLTPRESKRHEAIAN
jgi:FlaA1/EpsC-like NDP-sugar epimerase